MTAQTDVRDRIIAWLDGNGHASWCHSKAHGPCCNGECDCPQGPLVASLRAVLALHAPCPGDGRTWCLHEGYAVPAPCATTLKIADALGVTP